MGDISKNFKSCNTCLESKNIDSFEKLKDSYYRPMCKTCYNSRRRLKYESRATIKFTGDILVERIKDLIETIDGCDFIKSYIGDRKARQVVVRFGGKIWECPWSSIKQGSFPWNQARHVLPSEGFFLYRFLNKNGEILYLGKTINAKQRIASHLSPSEIKKYNSEWKYSIRSIEIADCKTEADMHILEMYLIILIKMIIL
jgi:hypothetical protein